MMEKWSYDNYPVEEFEFVRRLVGEVRRFRQEQNITNKTEVELVAVDNCPLTEGGRGLLKKLANAVTKAVPKDEIVPNSSATFFVKN